MSFRPSPPESGRCSLKQQFKESAQLQTRNDVFHLTAIRTLGRIHKPVYAVFVDQVEFVCFVDALAANAAAKAFFDF